MTTQGTTVPMTLPNRMNLGPFRFEMRACCEVCALVQQGLDGRVEARYDRCLEERLLWDAVAADLTGGLDVGQRTVEQDKGPAPEIVGQSYARDQDLSGLDRGVGGPEKTGNASAFNDPKGFGFELSPRAESGRHDLWMNIGQHDMICQPGSGLFKTHCVGLLDRRDSSGDQDQVVTWVDGACLEDSYRGSFDHRVGRSDSCGDAVDLKDRYCGMGL